MSGPHPAQRSKDAWTEETRGPPLDRKAPGNEKVTWECGGGERRGARPQKLSGTLGSIVLPLAF